MSDNNDPNNLRSIIPKEFYKGNIEHPTAETVSELIAQLQRLPGNMSVNKDEGGCMLVVYNIGIEGKAGVEVMGADNYD